MISEPQRPGASEVCFAIGEKSAGNYNKLFSDENKCIKNRNKVLAERRQFCIVTANARENNEI